MGTAAANAARIVNTATVEGNEPDPDPDNNEDTAITGLERRVDLAVTKTGPATVAAGGEISYTITVTNNGPSDSTGWGLTDPIPAGLLNAATTTPDCSISGGNLVCISGVLAVGDSMTISLTGTAAANATTITNIVTVDGNDPDPDPGNNEDTTTTTVTAAVDLAVAKTGPATVTAGGEVSYTITVTNNGPSASTGWTLTDPIPAGLQNAATTTPGCSVSTGTLTCAGGALAVGDSVTVSLTGTAAANATRIVNTATVEGNDPDPDPDNNESTTTTTVTPSVDLAVTKTGPATVTAGGEVSYTITVTNNGPSDSTGWTLTDPIPAGLQEAATATPGCSVSGGTLTCAGDTLAVGDSVTISLTGTAAPNATRIVNTATVEGNDPDPDPDNNESTTTTTVTPSVDLALTKMGPSTVTVGDTVSYTITVTNNGPSDSTGWTVSDPIPAGLANAATTTPGCSVNGGTLSCTGGALAVGDSTTITLTGLAGTVGTITNTAEVTGDDPDPNPDNNEDTTTTTVSPLPVPEVDLAVTKTGPASASPGDTVAYTITVTNNGPDPSTGWTLTDPVPAALTNAATTTPGCSISAATLTCTGGALAVGDSVTVSLTGTAAANAARIVNRATVEGDEPDPDPDNNESTAITRITPSVDLAVTKTGPATATAGDEVSYTITVTNNGPSDSTGWTVSDPIPAGLQNAATTTPGCSVSAGTLTCSGNSLAAGAQVTISLTGKAAADASSIVNTVTVTGDDPDPNPDNNEDTTTTTVGRSVDLAVAKTGPATVTAGGEVSYTITVTNNGPSDSTGWTLTDPIPAGLQNAATTTPGCSVSGGRLTCTGGALAVGESVTISLTGTAAPNAARIVNTATVDGNDPDPDPDNNESTTTTTVGRSVDLAVTKSGPATVTAGGEVSYTITVMNNGPSDSTGWTVSDPIPAGLQNAATATPGCSVSGGRLTCTGNSLAVGDRVTISLTGTAAANATRIINRVTVTGDDPDPDPDNNEDTTTTTVGRSVDLAVTKTGPATATAGDEVSYTITVTNNGPSDSTGWTLTDPIPLQLRNPDTTTPGCSLSDRTLTCTGGALAVGDSMTISLTGTAAPNADRIVNTAAVDGDDPDPDPDNNESTTTTTVGRSVDLAVHKSGPASVEAGARIAYTITLTNNGPSASTGWTVTDPIPVQIQNPTTTTEGCGIGSGRLICTGGALAVGESVTLTVIGTVADDATGTLTNTATVEGDDPDPDPGNNESTTTTTVTGRPGLTITKKQNGPATVKAGATVEYTITVTNTGATAYPAAGPASFTDDLSELLDDARYNGDATATRGTTTYDEPVLSWSGALAPGENATITFSVTTNARTFGDLKLINTVVSDTPGNNCPPRGDDPRCTTNGTVTPKDKDKDKPKAVKGARAA
ncbi:hypothetical protein CRV15_35080 (plasmid) [Streptomyces clavuligerus]|nr:DUF11 domain-containing protein [Streptomyces clavuligerus]QCS10980.1 hypothetical protein CRV15_35080 [Streptomyces clavuligerus]QPJ98422.1 DUF11 domain-containing protein [Streptomyces clavuligerus]